MNSPEHQAGMRESRKRYRQWIRVDADLLAAGYLQSPDGKVRYIHGLADIGQELVATGARVWWDMDLESPVAWCGLWSHDVILAGSMRGAWPWWVRRVLTHELMHLVLQTCNEDRVRRTQQALYGELVLPCVVQI